MFSGITTEQLSEGSYDNELILGIVLFFRADAEDGEFQYCPADGKLMVDSTGHPKSCLPHFTNLCYTEGVNPADICCYRSFGLYYCCTGVSTPLCPTYNDSTTVIYKRPYAEGTRLFPFRKANDPSGFSEYNNIVQTASTIHNGPSADFDDMPPNAGHYPNGAPKSSHMNLVYNENGQLISPSLPKEVSLVFLPPNIIMPFLSQSGSFIHPYVVSEQPMMDSVYRNNKQYVPAHWVAGTDRGSFA
ncbi:unnamed protein product [Soboliphyme baturini]|uniref:Clip domain-containing protein n=1 Tax=Soboliphyme baturini TaxID=241478 RepID=A0A183J469_9BILA|nr:unnamed protein product [Soboliphyme baturini]